MLPNLEACCAGPVVSPQPSAPMPCCVGAHRASQPQHHQHDHGDFYMGPLAQTLAATLPLRSTSVATQPTHALAGEALTRPPHDKATRSPYVDPWRNAPSRTSQAWVMLQQKMKAARSCPMSLCSWQRSADFSNRREPSTSTSRRSNPGLVVGTRTSAQRE